MFRAVFGPETTSRAAPSRRRSIANFQRAFPRARQADADGALLDVDFSAAGSTHVLRVFLPARFPSRKPVLQLVRNPAVRPLRHALVNEYATAPPLLLLLLPRYYNHHHYFYS